MSPTYILSIRELTYLVPACYKWVFKTRSHLWLMPIEQISSLLWRQNSENLYPDLDREL